MSILYTTTFLGLAMLEELALNHDPWASALARALSSHTPERAQARWPTGSIPIWSAAARRRLGR